MSTTETAVERPIGLGGATLIGLGAIVGGGVLALAGTAFALAGPSALLAFLLNGLVALVTAVSYAEMSSAFPHNGGSYAFTKRVMSVQAAFGVGWILLFASLAAGVLYALGLAVYALDAAAAIWRLAGEAPPAWLAGRAPMVLVAGAAILVYAIVLTRGQSGTGKAETLGKLAVFAVIIIGGLWALLREPDEAVGDKLTPFFAGGLTGLASAMGYTFIALQGFDIIAAVAGEVRDPERTLPRAMLGSVAIALVVYMPLLFVVMTVGVSAGESVTTLARARPETMIADAAGNFMGPTGYWLVTVAAILSMASALLANLLAASRITLAMASDRALPPGLASVSEATGIPTRAVVLCAVVMAFVLLVVPDVGTAGSAAGLIFLISFALTHVTNIIARRRMGPDFGAFRAPWFPVLQTTGAVCCTALAVYQSLAVPSAGALAAAWLLIGFVLYFTFLAERATVVDARSEATDPHLVRLRGRSPLVLVPLANPQRAQSLTALATALAAPAAGRVLLLSILSPRDRWTSDEVPKGLAASQEVMREAIREAMSGRAHTEALTTIADERWAEIARVAQSRDCEVVLLGLGNLDPHVGTGMPLERLIAAVEVETVVLAAPPGWQLAAAKRLLVPIGGAAVHNRLRARLIGSLCRNDQREVVFIRVVKPGTAPDELKRIERGLRRNAADEAPGRAGALVVEAEDVAAAILQHGSASDLVIVGTQLVRGRRSAIGDLATGIAQAAQGGVVLICQRSAAGPAS